MALHDRLKNPTLEQAPAKGHGLIVMVALAVMTAAFAYAMPGLQNVSAETEDPSLVVVESPTGSTHTPTADATPAEDEDDEAADGKADNHGKVVSTAAHCDIKGKAHGELVRSIAKDKEATVADAEAACQAAIAAQAAAVDEPKSNNGRGHEAKAEKTKPVRPGPSKSVDETETEDGVTEDAEAAEDSGTEDTEAGQGKGKPEGKGKP